MFHIARPNGGWYFQGPGGEGNVATGFEITEEYYPPFKPTKHDYQVHDMQEEHGGMGWSSENNQFRLNPNSASLKSLLRGFAATAVSADRLKQVTGWFRTLWDPAHADFSDDEF